MLSVLKIRRPSILLIGAGGFGRNHLRGLLRLHKEKSVNLAGVVTSNRKIKKLLGGLKVEVYRNFQASLLRKVDAVDIVTPASTHYKIVKACLPHSHVLVEKPLTLNSREARELTALASRFKRILFVGHIFRYNNAVSALKKIIRPRLKELYYIEGKFTGGGRPAKDCGVIFSDMHLQDILDYVLEKSPKMAYCRASTLLRNYTYEDNASILLGYGRKLTAFLKIGWAGEEKIRIMNFYFPKMSVGCDLLKQKIMIKKRGQGERKKAVRYQEPMLLEIKDFIHLIKGGGGVYPDGKAGSRAVVLCEKLLESARQNRPVTL